MPLPDVLRKLLTAAGPSGYETAPAAVFAEAGRAFTDDVEIDVMGSAVARVKGTSPGAPFLAVVGHIDEIGLIVTHIDDNGFLRFMGVGGWDPQILVGQRVALMTRDGVVPGVAGRKAIHLLKEEERDKVPKLRDLHIDIGAKNGDEARERVRIGDVAVIAGEPVQLANDRVVSRSMDNRLGAFIALESARLVAEAGGAPGDVAAVGVVQEEITFGGARTSSYRLQPDLAIVVDVTHETGSPGVEVNEIGKHEFGSGPVIERGSILNPVDLRAAARRRRTRGDPLHGAGLGALDGHRRRRDPPAAGRHPDRRRVGHAALHALAGRDGPARRRARLCAADRRVRAVAQRRDLVRSRLTAPRARPTACSCSSTSTGRCSSAPPTRTATRSTRRCASCTA